MGCSQTGLTVQDINPQKFKICQIVGESVNADFVTQQMWTLLLEKKQTELENSEALQWNWSGSVSTLEEVSAEAAR